jgi:transcriptional regulator with XRE-family HTH domain
MGTSEVQRGAVAERVRDNIKRIRQDRRLTGGQLAELLGALGRPMQPTAINKIETGARRVDVDDVVAISLALNTTPNRLLLNDPADHQAELEVAPHVGAAAFQAWAWANGQQVLLPSGRILGWGDATFGEVQRDFLRHAQPPAQHPAQEAADDLRGRVGAFLSWVEEYTDEKQRAVEAGEHQPAIPLDQLIISAEAMRQSLERLEGHIARVLEDSPLADQPGYGLAYFASAEVHQQVVSRVNAAREHAQAAQAAYASQEESGYKAKNALFAARERLAAAQASSDSDNITKWQSAAAATAAEVDQTMQAQIQAHEMASLAEEALQRTQRELYELRRMMLIRNMVPPQLAPALAYIDTMHPTDKHADHVQHLWERLNRSRLFELAAKSASTEAANPGRVRH